MQSSEDQIKTRTSRTLPANIKPEDVSIFKNDLARILPKAKIHHLENSNITPEGILFKNLNINKRFLIWPSHTSVYNKLYLASTLIKRKKIKLNNNQKYIACFDYWSNGYYHWICDFLPRLWLIRDYLPDNILLLPENYKNSFIEETLKAFNVKNTYYIPLNAYVHCQNLIIPDRITESGDNDPETMTSIRKTLVNHFKITAGSTSSENIYASRLQTKYRHIINEKEVINLVHEFGFKSICFEDMNLKEQIETMIDSKFLIGLHGANLTNALFMEPGSSILELRKFDPKHSNCYFSLANSMKLKYHYLHCKNIHSHKKGDHYGNIEIDLKQLRDTILLILSKT